MKINPVLRNESKISCRSFKFYALMLVYVSLLASPIIFAYYSLTIDVIYEGIYPSNFILLYIAMACVQAALLMFIVPALSATAITSEREKQTLDILLSTKMSPLSIIVGKLLSSTSRVILLIICTVPIYSLGFLVGGISIEYIFQLNLYFIVTTLFVASICIFISTCVKSSKIANVLSYICILTIVFGTVIFLILITFMHAQINGTIPKNTTLPFWMYINPALGFANLLFKQLGSVGPLEMFTNFTQTTGSWGMAILVQIILTILFVLSSAYVLNPLNKKKRFKKLFDLRGKKVK